MSTVAQAAFIFLPEEFLVLIIAAAGIAMIVGAKRLAMSLLTFVGMATVLPVLLYPLIEIVPIWLLWLAGVYFLFLLPYFCLGLIGNLVSPALGKSASSTMVGNMASSITLRALAAPFRLVGATYRLVARLIRATRG